MKTHFKSKSFSAPPQVEDGTITDLVIKMQQQLNFLEKKIDTLTGQSREKPFEKKHHSKPFERFEHSNRQREAKQDNNYRERILYKAICADCKKECEVPFKPSQDRPVYCKDCFSKRKGGGPFKGMADNKRREIWPTEVSHADKPHGGEKKKFLGKNRPAVKRREARA